MSVEALWLGAGLFLAMYPLARRLGNGRLARVGAVTLHLLQRREREKRMAPYRSAVRCVSCVIRVDDSCVSCVPLQQEERVCVRRKWNMCDVCRAVRCLVCVSLGAYKRIHRNVYSLV